MVMELFVTAVVTEEVLDAGRAPLLLVPVVVLFNTGGV